MMMIHEQALASTNVLEKKIVVIDGEDGYELARLIKNNMNYMGKNAVVLKDEKYTGIANVIIPDINSINKVLVITALKKRTIIVTTGVPRNINNTVIPIPIQKVNKVRIVFEANISSGALISSKVIEKTTEIFIPKYLICILQRTKETLSMSFYDTDSNSLQEHKLIRKIAAQKLPRYFLERNIHNSNSQHIQR